MRPRSGTDDCDPMSCSPDVEEPRVPFRIEAHEVYSVVIHDGRRVRLGPEAVLMVAL